jgi:hypothetical protein
LQRQIDKMEADLWTPDTEAIMEIVEELDESGNVVCRFL